MNRNIRLFHLFISLCAMAFSLGGAINYAGGRYWFIFMTACNALSVTTAVDRMIDTWLEEKFEAKFNQVLDKEAKKIATKAKVRMFNEGNN